MVYVAVKGIVTPKTLPPAVVHTSPALSLLYMKEGYVTSWRSSSRASQQFLKYYEESTEFGALWMSLFLIRDEQGLLRFGQATGYTVPCGAGRMPGE
jgi:hypothetical protein